MTYKELQRERLKKYLACEEAILINQEYTIGSRTYRRADLDIVRKMIQSLLDSGVTLEDDDQTFQRGRQTRAVFIEKRRNTPCFSYGDISRHFLH